MWNLIEKSSLKLGLISQKCQVLRDSSRLHMHSINAHVWYLPTGLMIALSQKHNDNSIRFVGLICASPDWGRPLKSPVERSRQIFSSNSIPCSFAQALKPLYRHGTGIVDNYEFLKFLEIPGLGNKNYIFVKKLKFPLSGKWHADTAGRYV